MTETISYVTIHAEPLKAVVRAIVTAAGSSAREADLVADHLVEANLTGHDSHGVGMLPRYVEVFLAGDLKINEHVTVVNDTGPLLTLNGNAGFGQVMGFEAMERGIERAAQHGVAVVGLANSHHIGRIGETLVDKPDGDLAGRQLGRGHRFLHIQPAFEAADQIADANVTRRPG